MNDAVRGFFDRRGLLEVETPVAVISPGLEPHLEPFEVVEIGPDRARHALYLHTSPEYAMKRMLGRGLGSIYQMARVFRNGERSQTHAPEFTMLEWYRSGGTLDTLMEDTEALVAEVAEAVAGPWRPKAAARFTVEEAFTRLGLPSPIDSTDARALAEGAGMPVIAGDDHADVFFRLMLERVEPSLEADRLTFLTHYPASMAALARLNPNDPRTALRFEAYIGGLELANAFDELVDPIEQRRRFEGDLETRRRLGRVEPPLDEGLLEDLGHMNPTAGIALGLDRLLMRCLGLDCVQDVIAFSPRDRD
jgi:lysyl-tRNA synthetase class 2